MVVTNKAYLLGLSLYPRKLLYGVGVFVAVASPSRMSIQVAIDLLIILRQVVY